MEWRAVISDSLALHLIRNNEISVDDFAKDENGNNIFLSYEAGKKVLSKYETKMLSRLGYVVKEGFGDSIREIINYQAYQLSEAIEKSDPAHYTPVLLR